MKMKSKQINQIQNDISIATAMIASLMSSDAEDDLMDLVEEEVCFTLTEHCQRMVDVLIPVALKYEAFEACKIFQEVQTRLDGDGK